MSKAVGCGDARATECKNPRESATFVHGRTENGTSFEYGECSIKHGRPSRGLRGQHSGGMSDERRLLSEAGIEERHVRE